MAVIAVNEQRAERRGREGEQGEREYTRVYLVESDNPDDQEPVILSAEALPKRGDLFAPDPAAICKTRLAQPHGDEATTELWRVTIQFATATGDEQDNPLERPADISWDMAQFREDVRVDEDGIPIRSSAGQPYDPAPQRDQSRPTLRIVRNEASYSASLPVEFSDSVNSDYFFGAAPGVAKCAKIAGRRATEGELTYWVVTYEFHFKHDGWPLRLEDQGTYELKDGKPKQIKDTDGIPITEPEFLDGNGNKLPAEDPPVVGEFRIYRSRAFAVLNLNNL
ncbi:hypothetical protein Pan216_30420 [Planctomycetes bacterium Pan216]|uniref:Uncharacterized protein n=1 Tax=Kolteria novifilia TaxID=2527975 RepID=A0A518B5D6_9BACT|nr:hypothetical protein Pan216_30420 [Planctomycetes bacterium Pan216]